MNLPTPRADDFRGDTQEGQLAIRRRSKIQLQQTDRNAIAGQCMDLLVGSCRIARNCSSASSTGKTTTFPDRHGDRASGTSRAPAAPPGQGRTRRALGAIGRSGGDRISRYVTTAAILPGGRTW